MNTVNLYNNDGTLSTRAQSLLSHKPDDMSMAAWRKIIKEFKSQLFKEDAKEFARLKTNACSRANYIESKEERLLRQRSYHHANKKERNAASKSYRQQNKEERKACERAYHLANKEERNAASRAYGKANKEKRRIYNRSYCQQNKEKRRAYNRSYCQQNKEKRRAYMSKYARARRQKDPLYKFFQSIRTHCNRVVKQVGLGKKPTNTFKWVGCSPEELKAHIESLFLEGMTWHNYGTRGWHVDHIRPISSFKAEEWEQINHYTNLQPLWWQDNLSKSNKY